MTEGKSNKWKCTSTFQAFEKFVHIALVKAMPDPESGGRSLRSPMRKDTDTGRPEELEPLIQSLMVRAKGLVHNSKAIPHVLALKQLTFVFYLL